MNSTKMHDAVMLAYDIVEATKQFDPYGICELDTALYIANAAEMLMDESGAEQVRNEIYAYMRDNDFDDDSVDTFGDSYRETKRFIRKYYGNV